MGQKLHPTNLVHNIIYIHAETRLSFVSKWGRDTIYGFHHNVLALLSSKT